MNKNTECTVEEVCNTYTNVGVHYLPRLRKVVLDIWEDEKHICTLAIDDYTCEDDVFIHTAWQMGWFHYKVGDVRVITTPENLTETVFKYIYNDSDDTIALDWLKESDVCLD